MKLEAIETDYAKIIEEGKDTQFQYWKNGFKHEELCSPLKFQRQWHIFKTKNDQYDNLKGNNQYIGKLNKLTTSSKFSLGLEEFEDHKQIKENFEQKNTILLFFLNQLILNVKIDDLIQEVQILKNVCNQMKLFNELESKFKR
ncbi:unnamed protein product [Paramecium octaurelia]|uniref:Uncharacterized protein n=1 Tax=Paramecium octaurelia TaxID=43137 RepID=A0A8S1XCJ1_PAROT|nr:unnamed protein product [Paramecium octaurelia]